ncbi:uncharacterized protein C8Q71DRAFT_508878 [Rhodofomes roseus]|uniref:Transposase n=1 Tax=Rhodofomes roseus TaxID=34475 RepID=A0ABQ8KM25_9APHY|nr:uncharacterized protein C8Q71DRAFT_508878 [Rhodofomes roseus]KAH9839373.1 hypothetical protein C8Q71DRAFT_508878 [Rhodofomes roseus]
MPAARRTSLRASRPAPQPLPRPSSASRSHSTTRQAQRDKVLSDQLIRYGCLWEEHAHHIRTKEKTEEGLTSTHARASDRWANDPEFSRGRGPTKNYAEEKGGYVEYIEGIIRARTKPITEMSVEDHCIISFAAISAYNVIFCNELSGDLERIGRLKPNISKNLFQCAQAYQNSEPDFLNHPARSKRPQTRKIEAEIRGVAQLGNTFKYKTSAMRKPRSCIVTLVATGLESTHYTIKHLTAKDPDGVRAQPVTLSEDDFRQIWDARVRD